MRLEEPRRSSPPLLRTAGERYARAMQQSERHILTTHAGSLPRPPALVDMYVRVSRREPVDGAPLEQECARYLRILATEPRRFTESFMTAASPGIVAAAMRNEHYPRYEDYVVAVADALRTEYEYVVSQGFVLQLDCPDLAMERHTSFADRPLEDFLAFVDVNVEAINRAIAGILPERVRMHVCWGNYEAPHVFDVPLEAILPRLYRARVGALVLSMANPRHAHEHRVLARHPLPAGMLLVAGVVDTTTNYVEHPEVVADRLERAAGAVGDPRLVP